MSIESAKAFIDRMKNDEEFAKKASVCQDAEQRMAFANDTGFNFTSAEIQEVGAELSDKELEAVAGGTVAGCSRIDVGHNHWDYNN